MITHRQPTLPAFPALMRDRSCVTLPTRTAAKDVAPALVRARTRIVWCPAEALASCGESWATNPEKSLRPTLVEAKPSAGATTRQTTIQDLIRTRAFLAGGDHRSSPSRHIGRYR